MRRQARVRDGPAGTQNGPVQLPPLGERGQGWVWIQALIMAAIPSVGGLARGWPAPSRIPLIVAGGAVVVLGCALLVVAIVALGDSFAFFLRPAPAGALVITGVYARARHPIYGGWILVGLGFALALSPWALPLAGLLALELSGKSRVEERALTARYPDYAAYRQQVPRRFFPLSRG
jgi:protein-S-isoprenylcysteine O-methyltransferase Ste14